MLGAIFGTGTNGAYVEDICEPLNDHTLMQYLITSLAKIKKLSGTLAAEYGGQMIVNTEWGAFNNSVGIYISITVERP